MNLERITMSNTEAVVKTAPSNWISVSERLPEDEKEVLIYVADGTFGSYMDVSHYNGNGSIKYWNNIYLNESVTHWQPLPQSPTMQSHNKQYKK